MYFLTNANIVPDLIMQLLQTLLQLLQADIRALQVGTGAIVGQAQGLESHPHQLPGGVQEGQPPLQARLQQI